jgi:hypothetical protein
MSGAGTRWIGGTCLEAPGQEKRRTTKYAKYAKEKPAVIWPQLVVPGFRVAGFNRPEQANRPACSVVCIDRLPAGRLPLHESRHPGAGRAIHIAWHCTWRTRVLHLSIACAQHACRGDSICRRGSDPPARLCRKCFARTLCHLECHVSATSPRRRRPGATREERMDIDRRRGQDESRLAERSTMAGAGLAGGSRALKYPSKGLRIGLCVAWMGVPGR